VAATIAASRLGITASRKVGNAVRRNRFKRRVREWFRRRRSELDPSVDLVVIARKSGAGLEMAELDRQLQSDIDGLEASYDPTAEQLDEVMVKPKSTDITLEAFGLAWMPYRKGADGRLSPDWV
jgi:RNase P protein component